MSICMENGLSWVREATEKNFVYVKWDGSKSASECPICHNHSIDGDYYGGNCIWFASAYLYHGMGFDDINCACNGLLGGSSAYTGLLLMSRGRAQKFIDSRLGPDRFTLVRKANRSKLDANDLKEGDIIVYYTYAFFWHVAVYIGNGRVIDCASEAGGVTERDWNLGHSCRVALRYIGK